VSTADPRTDVDPVASEPSGAGEAPAAPGAPGAPPSSAAGLPDDTRPEPGQLHLQGRRSWKSWQLAVFVVVACLLGMWFAYHINGSSSSAATGGSGSGSSGGSYKLPTEGGTSTGSGASGSGASGTTGTATHAAGAKGASDTTTTVAGASGSSTTTTVAAGAAAAGSATSTTQPLGQEAYLVPAHQASGNWTSPAFTIAGGTWYVGWAFQCNPVPAANPKFAVYVVAPGASPSGTPAVTSSAAQGQSVTNLTSTGSQQLVVQAPPQCEWVVKVTGYGGG
jgi:hypothetical protein